METVTDLHLIQKKIGQNMEKEEGRSLPLRSTFLLLLITQPWQPRPDDHCRYRKPCKLCGA